MNRYTIHTGDCREVLREYPDNHFDSIVTDPPYGIDYAAKGWDHGIPGEVFWREILRVAKPGAHLLAFGGTRTFHRLTCAIEDADWSVRDCLMWLHGQGFPKSHNLTGDWQGWGTALKPAWEPIIVARKPLDGTVAATTLKYGTGALNIDGCRVPGETVDDPARWPANLVTDGSGEAVAGLPGAAARFYYCAKASVADREEGLDDLPYGTLAYSGGAQGAEGRGEDTYTEGQGIGLNNLKRRKNTHPTVKPTDLMRYCIRLCTQPGGLVLDPFCGSGSTGKAALLEGARFVGIDLDPNHARIAEARCKHAAPKDCDKALTDAPGVTNEQLPLFDAE